MRGLLGYWGYGIVHVLVGKGEGEGEMRYPGALQKLVDDTHGLDGWLDLSIAYIAMLA